MSSFLPLHQQVLRIIVVAAFVALIFPVSRLSVNATEEPREFYPGERDALVQLRDSMSSHANLHALWTGPPCFWNLSNWPGIACWNGHVVRLVLEGIQLTGSLPPAFPQNITLLTKLSLRNNSVSGQLPDLSNLVHLEYVFMSSNRFTGSVPFQYIELPNLKKLELQQNYLDGEIPPFNQPTLTAFNVSYNHLQGLIPKTSVLQRFPVSSFDQNSNLCGSPLEPCPVLPPTPSAVSPPSPSPQSPPHGKRNKRKVWSIVLIAVAAVLIPFLVMLAFLCYYRKVHGKESRQEREAGDGSGVVIDKKVPHSHSTDDPERTVELEFFDKSIPVFDLDDLLRASAEVLGKGTLGTTYKATLESGSVVAVKRVKNMNSLSKKEFLQQMQLLGNMRHQNLVQIISFYYSKEEKLVVYEFVPHGNLFDLLHETRGAGRVPLDWAARLSIIKDMAKGLVFLHQSMSSHRVPHANLKSSNVLISRDNNTYQSKLTDYGFYPLLSSRKASQNLAVRWSPEFGQGKKLTHKADIYCFGIVLLELITGKIPGEISPGNGNGKRVDDLSEWVRTVVNNDWSTDILDVEILASRERHNEMLRLTEIALECTDMPPERRPKMTEVLRRIEEIEQRSTEHELAVEREDGT